MSEKLPQIPNFGGDFAPTIPLIQRRFYCAYHNVGTVPRWEQRKEIISALWSDDVYKWHRWNERRLKGLCSHRWNTWAGPAGSGKSADAAMFALSWWLENPAKSAVILCSTTKDLLRKRVWSYIVEYYNALYARFGDKARKREEFGTLLDSETKVRWRQGDDKNCIFGVAVGDGPVEEAINNLIGIHTTRVFLILDEMQGVREAIVSPKVLGNLATNPQSYFLGMGNPEDFNDPLGRFSTPLSGWPSVHLGDDEEWETQGGPLEGNGLCQCFNGTRSPADDSPEERKRLSWMINKDHVKAHLDYVNGNEQDPSFQSQKIGIWPMSGLEATVLDEQTISTFHCREKAVWTEKPTACAGLDPAFTVDGDKCVLQFGKRGRTEIDGNRKWVVELGEWVSVPIKANDGTPVDYQIVYFCKKECEKRGIPAHEFATDSTGVGGGLLSIFQREWGNVLGVDFRGRATDRPVSETNPKPAHEEYDRRASELNFSVRAFAVADSLRGLSAEAAQQFCSRRTEYKNKKNRVETKPEMKKRIGRSPDNADAVAVLIDLARERGATPSAKGLATPRPDWSADIRKAQGDFSEENYLESEYANT